MPDTNAAEIAPWVQATGVVGFAGLVYMELRAYRGELKALRGIITRMGELLAVLLDRDRAVRQAAREGSRPTRVPTAPVVVEDGDDAQE